MNKEEVAAPEAAEPAADINPAIPHVPRVLDYLLGGTANFESDREAAAYAFASWPGETGGIEGVRVDIRAARGALRRMVTYMAAECGVRQFLDIAAGLPTMGNTHLSARAAGGGKTVYVDNDPLVVAYSRQLLAAEDKSDAVFFEGSFTFLDDILARAADTLDFSQPIGVVLYGMLHFLEEEDSPHGLFGQLLDALPTGSFIAVSHFARDDDDTAMNDTLETLDRQLGEAVVRRTRAEVESFFADMELLPPGVAETHLWRPGPGDNGPRPLPMWVALARKPGTRELG